MCGITGVLNLYNREPINPEQLQAANDTLYHRGPDDQGMYVEDNFGMAMRRLSIIDLVSGQQPISSANGKVHICYNGELYNHKMLRLELQALGYHFRTNSDTEVVLNAYIQWGPERSLEKLRGMFAFSIWESDKQRLFLARDRMGIKPLYYTEYKGRLYFASEIRGILLHSRMQREVNIEALDAFMRVGFVTSPHSLFKGIQKLPPAHYILVKNGKISIHKYWELSYNKEQQYSESDVIDRFRELLSESVGIHMMSDVSLGALLSGGIDSITNVALMKNISQAPVKTVCIGFEASTYDESEKAAAAALALGTEHSTVTFAGNNLDEYPKALYYREEPTADATFAASYYLFQACKQQNLKVVLSGEGSDELLGGYSWHRWEHWIHPVLRLPDPIRAAIASLLSRRSKGEGGLKMGAALRNSPEHIHQRYQDYLMIGDPVIREGLFSAEVKSVLTSSKPSSILESWSDYLSPVTKASTLDQLLWLQSRTRMVDYVNQNVDRMSMAHSVESRPPFLDHRLWEFCATIPDSIKLNDSYLKPIEKYLLRQAVQNIVPEDARLRKKMGLSVPHESWLMKKRLPEWAEYAFSGAKLREFGMFDPASIFKLRHEHQSGAPGRGTLLMGVLAVQTWAHLFLESPLDAGPP